LPTHHLIERKDHLTVWRAFFLAIGAMLIIVGIETLLIDSATIYSASNSSASDLMDPSGPPSGKTKVVQPGEWLPWSAMSVGAIVVLYAFTLPQRWGRGG
jgi:hypothetical protein